MVNQNVWSVFTSTSQSDAENKIKNLNSGDFELFCDILLRRRHPGEIKTTTKRGGDGGVDAKNETRNIGFHYTKRYDTDSKAEEDSTKEFDKNILLTNRPNRSSDNVDEVWDLAELAEMTVGLERSGTPIEIKMLSESDFPCDFGDTLVHVSADQDLSANGFKEWVCQIINGEGVFIDKDVEIYNYDHLKKVTVNKTEYEDADRYDHMHWSMIEPYRCAGEYIIAHGVEAGTVILIEGWRRI